MSTSSTKHQMLFASAMMLSVATASDHISHALNKLDRTTHDHKPIAPARRFNLEAILPALVDEQSEEEPYWREGDHEYEAPVHDPKYHEDFPERKVDTYHGEPIDTGAHPSERRDRTFTEERNNDEEIIDPENYFYEFPAPPKVGHYLPGE